MKLINLTSTDRDAANVAFQAYLLSVTNPGTKLDFKYDLATKATGDRQHIVMSPSAFTKMMELVKLSSIEIAWHGVVTVSPTGAYCISDILCYPQKAAACTVESDDDKYPDWLNTLDDNTINKLRFQGHSHVNMGVTPSGTDTANWDMFTGMISNDGFYIFCIANKSYNISWWIYDKATNLIYEPADIDFDIFVGDGNTAKSWGTTAIADNLTQRVWTAPTTTIPTIPATTAPVTGGNYRKIGSDYWAEDEIPVGEMPNGLEFYSYSNAAGLYHYSETNFLIKIPIPANQIPSLRFYTKKQQEKAVRALLKGSGK